MEWGIGGLSGRLFYVGSRAGNFVKIGVNIDDSFTNRLYIEL